MAGITAEDAIALLENHPDQYAAVESLKALADLVSIDAPGSTTVLYSGTAGNVVGYLMLF